MAGTLAAVERSRLFAGARRCRRGFAVATSPLEWSRVQVSATGHGYRLIASQERTLSPPGNPLANPRAIIIVGTVLRCSRHFPGMDRDRRAPGSRLSDQERSPR